MARPAQPLAVEAPVVATKVVASAKFVFEEGDHELAKLVDAASRFLGRTYLSRPEELPAEGRLVRIPRRLEVDAAGCDRVLGRLAMQWDLLATPVDVTKDVWEFIYLNGPRRADVQHRSLHLTSAEVLAARERSVWVTTTYVPQHADINQLSQCLRPFYASAGPLQLNIGTAPNGVVILSGLAASVAGALDVLRDADQPRPILKVEDDRLAAMEKRIVQMEAVVARLEAALKR